jgi:hypothetical protein
MSKQKQYKSTATTGVQNDTSEHKRKLKRQPHKTYKYATQTAKAPAEYTYETHKNKESQQPCAQCNRTTGKTCSICRQAFYCSKECQKIQWPTHKHICKSKTITCYTCENTINPAHTNYTSRCYKPFPKTTTTMTYCSRSCQRHEVN